MVDAIAHQIRREISRGGGIIWRSCRLLDSRSVWYSERIESEKRARAGPMSAGLNRVRKTLSPWGRRAWLENGKGRDGHSVKLE